MGVVTRWFGKWWRAFWVVVGELFERYKFARRFSFMSANIMAIMTVAVILYVKLKGKDLTEWDVAFTVQVFLFVGVINKFYMDLIEKDNARTERRVMGVSDGTGEN